MLVAWVEAGMILTKAFRDGGETLLRLTCILRRHLRDTVRLAIPPPPRSAGEEGRRPNPAMEKETKEKTPLVLVGSRC